jgi:hypothetical protein
MTILSTPDGSARAHEVKKCGRTVTRRDAFWKSNVRSRRLDTCRQVPRSSEGGQEDAADRRHVGGVPQPRGTASAPRAQPGSEERRSPVGALDGLFEQISRSVDVAPVNDHITNDLGSLFFGIINEPLIDTRSIIGVASPLMHTVHGSNADDVNVIGGIHTSGSAVISGRGDKHNVRAAQSRDRASRSPQTGLNMRPTA